MKVARIGASGKTGTKLVGEYLRRGHSVLALCRHSSVHKLDTFGEVTAEPEEGERLTPRQRVLESLGRLISWIAPYSLADMVKESALVREEPDWDWTIVRAPTLRDTPAVGYQFCEISKVNYKHFLSREDYAACLLDSLDKSDHSRRTLTVVSADE